MHAHDLNKKRSSVLPPIDKAAQSRAKLKAAAARKRAESQQLARPSTLPPAPASRTRRDSGYRPPTPGVRPRTSTPAPLPPTRTGIQRKPTAANETGRSGTVKEPAPVKAVATKKINSKPATKEPTLRVSVAPAPPHAAALQLVEAPVLELVPELDEETPPPQARASTPPPPPPAALRHRPSRAPSGRPVSTVPPPPSQAAKPRPSAPPPPSGRALIAARGAVTSTPVPAPTQTPAPASPIPRAERRPDESILFRAPSPYKVDDDTDLLKPYANGPLGTLRRLVKRVLNRRPHWAL